MSKGVFEEFFSYEPEAKPKGKLVKFDPIKKDKKSRENKAERERSEAFTLADRMHEAAMLRTDSAAKIIDLKETVLDKPTKLPFLIASPMLYDVLNALDVPFEDLDQTRMHAAMLIIWSYVQEYEKQKAKFDGK